MLSPTATLAKIVSDCNAERKAKGTAVLSVNSALQQIIKQWVTSIKGRMTLQQYIQLYGFHNTHSLTFPALPPQYIAQVVTKAAPSLTNPQFEAIGLFAQPNGANYDLIIVLIGGSDALQTDFSKEDLAKIIKDIESKASDFPIQSANITNLQNVSDSVPVSASNVSSQPDSTN